MNLFNILNLGAIFQSVSSLLTGGERISYHEYSKLNPNQIHTMCEVKTGEVDISRVTAVRQLPKNECGACLRVTAKGKSVYVMAIDMGGAGLDLSEEAFSKFASPSVGRLPAKWTQVPISNCQGIYRGHGTIGHLKEYNRSYQPNQREVKKLIQRQNTPGRSIINNYYSPRRVSNNNYNRINNAPKRPIQGSRYQSQSRISPYQKSYQNQRASRFNVRQTSNPYNSFRRW